MTEPARLWLCRLLTHRWVVDGRTEQDIHDGRWHREIRRCERCGYRIHQYYAITPPRRGTV